LIKRFIKERISKTKEKGSFSYGISWTFSWASLSFILQLIFAPILSRIYGPEAYGEFAVYNLIATNFILIASVSYPQALLVNQDLRRFSRLSILILILTLLSIFLFSVFYFPFKTQWQKIFLDLEGIKWIPIVLLVVILSTTNDILNKWNIRNSNYKFNLRADITGQILSKISSIIYGIKIIPNGFGIILAELIRNVAHLIVILGNRSSRKLLFSFTKLNRNVIQEANSIRKDLVDYPKFIFPGTWINIISNQLPIIFFSTYFGIFELGAYTFAGSLIAIPNKLIGNAIRPVFFNKAQQILESEGKHSLKQFTQKVTLYLTGVGTSIFFLIILFGEYIFTIVFGDSWALAGQVASYQAIFQISAFSITPIRSIFLILKNENKLFKFELFLFVIRIVSLFLLIYLGLDFIKVVLIYSVINLFIFSILHVVIYRMLK